MKELELKAFVSQESAAMQPGMRLKHTPPHSHASLPPAALRNPTSLISIQSDEPCSAKVYEYEAQARKMPTVKAVDHLNAERGFALAISGAAC
jgi:hypothetical protein